MGSSRTSIGTAQGATMHAAQRWVLGVPFCCLLSLRSERPVRAKAARDAARGRRLPAGVRLRLGQVVSPRNGAAGAVTFSPDGALVVAVHKRAVWGEGDGTGGAIPGRDNLAEPETHTRRQPPSPRSVTGRLRPDRAFGSEREEAAEGNSEDPTLRCVHGRSLCRSD